jgi:hypothetical protein
MNSNYLENAAMILCGFGCVLEIENETGFSQFMVQAGMERGFL